MDNTHVTLKTTNEWTEEKIVPTQPSYRVNIRVSDAKCPTERIGMVPKLNRQSFRPADKHSQKRSRDGPRVALNHPGSGLKKNPAVVHQKDVSHRAAGEPAGSKNRDDRSLSPEGIKERPSTPRYPDRRGDQSYRPGVSHPRFSRELPVPLARSSETPTSKSKGETQELSAPKASSSESQELSAPKASSSESQELSAPKASSSGTQDVCVPKASSREICKTGSSECCKTGSSECCKTGSSECCKTGSSECCKTSSSSVSRTSSIEDCDTHMLMVEETDSVFSGEGTGRLVSSRSRTMLLMAGSRYSEVRDAADENAMMELLRRKWRSPVKKLVPLPAIRDGRKTLSRTRRKLSLTAVKSLHAVRSVRRLASKKVKTVPLTLEEDDVVPSCSFWNTTSTHQDITNKTTLSHQDVTDNTALNHQDITSKPASEHQDITYKSTSRLLDMIDKTASEHQESPRDDMVPNISFATPSGCSLAEPGHARVEPCLSASKEGHHAMLAMVVVCAALMTTCYSLFNVAYPAINRFFYPPPPTFKFNIYTVFEWINQLFWQKLGYY